jgi:hypothetical protein
MKTGNPISPQWAQRAQRKIEKSSKSRFQKLSVLRSLLSVVKSVFGFSRVHPRHLWAILPHSKSCEGNIANEKLMGNATNLDLAGSDSVEHY